MAEPSPSVDPKCDRVTAEERRTGVGLVFKQHRWTAPVAFGDRCQCGERVADAGLVKVLSGDAFRG